MRILFFLIIVLIIGFFTMFDLPILNRKLNIYQNSTKFTFISKDNLSNIFPIHFINSENIYLPNIYSSFSVPKYDIIDIKGTTLYQPPTITLNHTLFNQVFPLDQNLSLDNNDLFHLFLDKQLFSTFGISLDKKKFNTKPFNLVFSVYVHGATKPYYSDQLPPEYLKFYIGNLCEPVEFLFYMYNNAILGNPTITKTSGIESLDESLFYFLLNSKKFIGLPDGYYRFSLPP